MPGYRLANPDKARIDAKYFCTYCKLLLRDAMQTSCGHFYCQSCLPNLIQDRVQVQVVMVCLVDKQQLLSNEVFADKFIRREVFDVVVRCTSMEDGCKWKGGVRHLECHTSSCEYQTIPCVNRECTAMVKKALLREHLENECMFRLVECELCHSQIVLNRMTLHKENECLAYLVVCEKCSREGIPRGKLADHQNPVMGDCEGVEGPCPFSQIGCVKKEVLSQMEKKEHLTKENVHHSILLLQFAFRVSTEMESVVRSDPRVVSRSPQMFTNYDNAIRDLLNQMQINSEERSNLEEKLREHRERITSLERKVASVCSPTATSTAQHLSGPDRSLPNAEVTRRLTSLEEKTADHEVLLVENNRKTIEMSREVANLRQLEGAQETLRRAERRIESIEHTLALRNVTLADLEEYVRQDKFSSYDGMLLWKITEFSRRRNEAVSGQTMSFYSPCFHTSRYGYKMCARIYLNGDGMGRGTHISVFFVIMRGQYDALLRWPFREKVTIMLLDQDNVQHVIDAFRPDPSSSSFQRPRREMNIVSGCPMFFPLIQLNSHAYVREDTMFLQITVDTSEL